MAGFLFHEVVFGPVRSRRLGLSLGVNLLPLHSKFCTFNCIYCECGWTPVNEVQPVFPTRQEIFMYLERRLRELVADDYLPDAITYAGNGEPTVHPDFAGIVEDTIKLRNTYTPKAKVTILSNASMIQIPSVFEALKKLDNNILKLDAGSAKLFRLMNNPVVPVRFPTLIEGLKRFNGELIIQSMFLRGHFRGEFVDNTTPQEVESWLTHLVDINPKLVMIYPIARETPVHNLEKIDIPELEAIAEKVRQAGLKVQVVA
ncbi:MAG: radical SAM protein [Bacteroidales bacterium]|jgi:wyosine [tRNA(Phe)-imidazoG37] synthetase (radical SAM superfamily)|nr:radical SAM protein [Bacteroidales bacterium]